MRTKEHRSQQRVGVVPPAAGLTQLKHRPVLILQLDKWRWTVRDICVPSAASALVHINAVTPYCICHVTALGTSRCAPTNAQMRSRCTRTAFSSEVAVARQLSHATHRHTRRHSSLQRCLWSPAQARRHPARAETRPTSPAKDKPTAVRPSAGLEIDHLDPVG